jgi:hypothetical protein
MPYNAYVVPDSDAGSEYTQMNSTDLGFAFKQSKNGDVSITHNGKHAATLRKEKAEWFLEDMSNQSFEGQQQEMARLTGNYRRGNERTAKQHPRNR